MKQEKLHVVIIGPQGSGKGTQATFLAEHFNLVHIETGKMLRRVARQATTLGRSINHLINEQGRLVSSQIVTAMLKQQLAKIGKHRGIIFDGYPRNLGQARSLNRLLSQFGRVLTHVIYLPISKQTTIKRLARRRTCRRCDRVFIDGKDFRSGTKRCPVCGGELYQRKDDTPAAIARRLDLFTKQTKPIITYYKEKGLLIIIDGEPSIKRVKKEILKQFQSIT